MFDCTTNRYDEIYAPWLESPETLLELAGYRPGDRLLDLCGGTGVVAKAALRMNPNTPRSRVILYDLNPRCRDDGILQIPGHAEALSLTLSRQSFDVAVCRQALGYLRPEKVFPEVAAVMKPGGRFAFNSFEMPTAFGKKCYRHKDARYLEAHLFLGGKVFHLQHRFGSGWDVSVFQYHSREKLVRLLAPWFTVQAESHGRGSHWLCVRKREA